MVTEAELAQIAPRLSEKWNASASSHSFLYAHSQSSMEYVIKVDRLGGKAEIRGIGLGDERISRFEITARDYISNSALPLRITLTDDGEENRSDLEAKLKDVFISPHRIQGQELTSVSRDTTNTVQTWLLNSRLPSFKSSSQISTKKAMKSQLLLEMHTMREKRATLVDNHARIRCETQDFQSQPVHILSTTRLLLLDAILFQQVTFHPQDSMMNMT